MWYYLIRAWKGDWKLMHDSADYDAVLRRKAGLLEINPAMTLRIVARRMA